MIMISPFNLQVYNSSYGSQSQALMCQVENINEFSTHQYEFNPKAYLTFDADHTTVLQWTGGAPPSLFPQQTSTSDTDHYLGGDYPSERFVSNSFANNNIDGMDLTIRAKMGDLGDIGYSCAFNHWFDFKVSARVYDGSWSSRKYSGTLRMQCPIDEGTGTISFRNKNNISRVEIGVYFTGNYSEGYSTDVFVIYKSLSIQSLVGYHSSETVLATGSLNYMAIGE